MRHVVVRLVDTWRRFGSVAVLRLLVDRLGNRVVRVIHVLWLDGSTAPAVEPAAAGVDYRFLAAEEVQRFAADPGNDLGHEFAERVAAGRDLCFAALIDDRLVAYGWYALGSVELAHTLGVPLSYPQHVAYMYKAFTLPAYRGARLHGITVRLALQQLSERGVTALVSMVDWTNDASLRSCAHGGYERLGRLWVLRFPMIRVVTAPRRASQCGIRFGRAAVPRPSALPSKGSVTRAA